MRSIWGGGHVHVHGGAEPFLPALGTVHLSPSTTKTLHVVETSLVKAAVSSPPTWTHPQGDTGGGGSVAPPRTGFIWVPWSWFLPRPLEVLRPLDAPAMGPLPRPVSRRTAALFTDMEKFLCR